MSRRKKKKKTKGFLGGRNIKFSNQRRMSAWKVTGENNNSYGSSSSTNLEFSPLEAVPNPGSNEVLVKLKAAGLNPCDSQMISGSWPIHEKVPWIPGVDGSGIIEEIGENVIGFEKGDRVLFFTNLYGEMGTFSEYTVVESHLLSRIPDTISFEEASGVPCAGYTSYIAINRRLRVSKKDTILIHSGTGGTGSYGIQFAKAQGAKVIATCSNRNREFVTEVLGADHVISYKDNLIEKVMEITNNEGVDMIYNTYSSSNNKDLPILKNNGHVAYIAGRPRFEETFEEYTKTFSLHEIYLGSVFDRKMFHKVEMMKTQQLELGRIGEEIMKLMEQGKVKTIVSQVFGLDRLEDALKLLNNRKGIKPGKIIIRM